MAEEKQHLSQIVEDLKTNLDAYRGKAIRNDIDGVDIRSNEWVLQIADIYEEAYSEELDLDNLIID